MGVTLNPDQFRPIIEKQQVDRYKNIPPLLNRTPASPEQDGKGVGGAG